MLTLRTCSPLSSQSSAEAAPLDSNDCTFFRSPVMQYPKMREQLGRMLKVVKEKLQLPCAYVAAMCQTRRINHGWNFVRFWRSAIALFLKGYLRTGDLPPEILTSENVSRPATTPLAFLS